MEDTKITNTRKLRNKSGYRKVSNELRQKLIEMVTEV
jgi:hypothetical protein